MRQYIKIEKYDNDGKHPSAPHTYGGKMQIPKFFVGDTLELKKQHPCGEKLFSVLFCGSDVKIKCKKCGRDLTLERIKLEKMIKRVISKNED